MAQYNIYSFSLIVFFYFYSIGTYNINDEITKANSRHATAPFKSKSDRNLPMNPNAFPGPGTYNPFDAISLPDRKKLP